MVNYGNSQHKANNVVLIKNKSVCLSNTEDRQEEEKCSSQGVK